MMQISMKSDKYPLTFIKKWKFLGGNACRCWFRKDIKAGVDTISLFPIDFPSEIFTKIQFLNQFIAEFLRKYSFHYQFILYFISLLICF